MLPHIESPLKKSSVQKSRSFNMPIDMLTDNEKKWQKLKQENFFPVFRQYYLKLSMQFLTTMIKFVKSLVIFKKYTPQFIFYHLHFSLQNSVENSHSLPSVIECNMFLEGGMLAYLIDAYTEKRTFSLNRDSEDKGKIARTVR